MVERHTYHTMFPFSPGAGMQVNVEYVRASDYDAIAAELARVQKSHDYWDKKHDGLKARIAALEAALDECCHDWRDTKVWLTNSAIGRAARGFTSETKGDAGV